MRQAIVDPQALPPPDPNTGLPAVIYSVLLRRLGDRCENDSVIIARSCCEGILLVSTQVKDQH